MAQFYAQKPENAIKRADELVSLGQQSAALTLLLDFILSKRFRSTPITSLEPIMFKFVSLAVELRKGKNVKEALHQYKNIAQNVAISTIEMVIKSFISSSEDKVTAAQSKADKISLLAIEDLGDLDEGDTPEAIILSTVSGDVGKDRTDRELVTPWLKFLWEAYRTALDILRNNSRLEVLYQSVANQAFQFCLKYARKTEFRRLCELLRQHLTSAAKYGNQQHSINLNEIDTLQRYLDTRFVQLNAAIKLDLWQEAFRSIEDVHHLMSISKKPPKPFMMANYYEKLSTIFLVGENYLFHAAAWNKHYATARQHKTLSEEEHSSIPIFSTSSKSRNQLERDENKPNQRLSVLLRVAKAPTRDLLLKEANILARVRPELRELYNLLEVQFHPLSICKKAEPIMRNLGNIPELAQYVKPLHAVILARLLQQLSQVYRTIAIESVVQLASFSEPFNYTSYKIEMFILNACKKGDLNIRIDHEAQIFSFENDSAFGDAAVKRSLPTDQLRVQLDELANRLQVAITKINPEIEKYDEMRRKAIDLARKNAEKDRLDAIKQTELIVKKTELNELERVKQEREDAVARLRAQAEASEAEKHRIEVETRRREDERIKSHRAEIQKQEKLKLAAKLADELEGKNLKIKGDTSSLDTEKLVELQMQQLDQEKRDAKQKIKVVAKRHDHLQRAFKKEEIRLLEDDYEKQKKLDRAYHKTMTEAKSVAAKLKHENNLEIKKRLIRMIADHDDFKKNIQSARNEKHASLVKEADIKLKAAKAQRCIEYKEKKESEEKTRAAELAEESARKENEERQAKERQETERIRVLKVESDRAGFEERKVKLDKQAKLQAERDQRAEDKIRASNQRPDNASREDDNAWHREPAKSASGRVIPGSAREPPVRRSDSGASSGSGVYVPPSRKMQEPASRTEESLARSAKTADQVPPSKPLPSTSTPAASAKFIPPHLRNKGAASKR